MAIDFASEALYSQVLKTNIEGQLNVPPHTNFIIAPNQIGLLVKDPLGIQMANGAVILQIVGALIIRSIVDVEY